MRGKRGGNDLGGLSVCFLQSCCRGAACVLGWGLGVWGERGGGKLGEWAILAAQRARQAHAEEIYQVHSNASKNLMLHRQWRSVTEDMDNIIGTKLNNEVNKL